MDDTPEKLTCRHELLIDRYFLASFIPSIPIATSLKEVTETSYLPVTTIVIWFMCIIYIYIYIYFAHETPHFHFLKAKKHVFGGKSMRQNSSPPAKAQMQLLPTNTVKANQPAKSEINLLHFAPVFRTGKNIQNAKDN